MQHEIRIRAYYGDDMRSIVWDDATGTVSGDHEIVPALQADMEAEVVTIGAPWGSRDITGHRHDPADFLALLWQFWGGFPAPKQFRVALPDSLANVAFTPVPLPEDHTPDTIY